MSFDARDVTVHLVPGAEGPGLFACNACNTTAGGVPKPACPPPSKPQCQAPSAKPKPKPKPKPKKNAAELEALDLALLRNQLRETLHRF